MSTKSKKSAPSWFKCEKCHASVAQRDLEIHDTENCPPSTDKFVHPYIRDGCLTGPLEIKANEELKGMTHHDKNNLVFLSQSAIQQCSLVIGEWAVLETLQSAVPSCAKIVWPTADRSLGSVQVTAQAHDLYWKHEPDCKVRVSRLSTERAKALRELVLVAVNAPKTLEFTAELSLRTRALHRLRFVTRGNKLSVLFYGKFLEFLVKDVVVASDAETGASKPKNDSSTLQNDSSTLQNDSFTLQNDSFTLQNDSSTLQNDASTLQNDASTEQTLATELTIGDKAEFYQIVNTTLVTVHRTDAEAAQASRRADLWSQLGAVDAELAEIQDLMDVALGRVAGVAGMAPTRGVLLHGPPGTGKTMMARALADRCPHHVVSVNGPDLCGPYTGDMDTRIAALFQEALDTAPCLVLLDEVDALCPVRSARLLEPERRTVSAVLRQLDRLTATPGCRVFVLATSARPDAIDPAFRRCGRLEREIEVCVPSPRGRHDILRRLLASAAHTLTEPDLAGVAGAAHGFVGADLGALCSRAALHAVQRSDPPPRITRTDLDWALGRVRPSAMRTVHVEVPDVRWTDIGGQHRLKLALRQAVEWPLRHAGSFVRLGVTPPRGLLMFGPPGCSKTMIARALATESRLNFLAIKGPELFSKWVGESERAVREVFRRARQVAPAVIFFDEIDALGGERAGGGNGGPGSSVQERVLAQLLTELDGVTPLGDVTVLAATNRPDRIDKALLRPGRLDRIVYVPLPDEETRREIFALKLARMPVQPCVSVDRLVALSEGYSGAEVQAVCHEAAMKALEEDIEASSVTGQHFEQAFQIITPRTPPSLVKLYEEYLQK